MEKTLFEMTSRRSFTVRDLDEPISLIVDILREFNEPIFPAAYYLSSVEFMKQYRAQSMKN